MTSRQRIDLGGAIGARRKGAGPRFDDLFHAAMEMTWPGFVLTVCAVFGLLNIAFGTVYAAMPGSVANAAKGSLLDGVFFSIETLGTAAYGHLYPATRLARLVVSGEILVGLFFTATVTGLIFARFSRPQKGMSFSSRAVICRHRGRLALMIRVVSTRSRPLANVEAQVAWLETIDDPKDDYPRRLTELELVQKRNPMFGLSWTLMHVVDEDGPFLRALRGDGRFYITAYVQGTDVLLSSQSAAMMTYTRREVLWNRKFRQMLIPKGDDVIVDMRLLDVTDPLTTADGGG